MPYSFAADDEIWTVEPPRAILSEHTLAAAEKYTQIKLTMEQSVGKTMPHWEHARSYAVEAVFSLLMDNPAVFRLAHDMKQILDERKR